MNKMKKSEWLSGWRLAIGLVLLAAAGWGVKRYFFAPPSAPQVITAKVAYEDLEDTVLASGTIQAQ